MKIRLTYRKTQDHSIMLTEDIEVGTAAMRGRDDSEISFIISLYVEQWAAQHEWYIPSLHTLHWASIDQGGIGLSYVPSEPRDDGY